MTRKRAVLLSSVVVVGLLAGLGAYIYDFHLSSKSTTTTHGDDPRILVRETLGHPDQPVWGRLRFDERTKCLYLETSSSWETRSVLDRPVAVIWPKGSRPVFDDGRRGVRVGAFLGRLGGTVLYEGDLLFGAGRGGTSGSEPAQPLGDDCRTGTESVAFGEVAQVEELPDI